MKSEICKLPLVVLMVLLATLSQPALADCYFIALRGFDVSKNPDVVFWGDWSPLIALEPGRLYPLSPERQAMTRSGSGHVKNMQGQFYYIPQHLIDSNQHFSLRMMVVDPDSDTADDTLLPMTEKLIPLATDTSSPSSQQVTVDFLPFAELFPPEPNAMRFVFEVRKRTGMCDKNTAEGKQADLHNRQQNELKRLLVRVVTYGQKQLYGGREYLPYRLPEISTVSYTQALKLAWDIADVNSRELIALGQEIYSLHEAPDFSAVWEEYTVLVKRLLSQSLLLKYNKDGKKVRTNVPSLVFHPQWKNLDSRISEITLPQEWKVALPLIN